MAPFREALCGYGFIFNIFAFLQIIIVNAADGTVTPSFGCAVLEMKRPIYLCLGDVHKRKLAMLTLASQQNRLVSLLVVVNIYITMGLLPAFVFKNPRYDDVLNVSLDCFS